MRKLIIIGIIIMILGVFIITCPTISDHTDIITSRLINEHNSELELFGSILLSPIAHTMVKSQTSYTNYLIISISKTGAIRSLGILGKVIVFSIPDKYDNAAAKADIRNACNAQTMYYEDHKVYCKNINDLIDAEYGFYPSSGVTLEIIIAGYGCIITSRYTTSPTYYTSSLPGDYCEIEEHKIDLK